MSEYRIVIEADVRVTAPSAHKAIEMVIDGSVPVNPVVLIRCPAVGSAHVHDIRLVNFQDGVGPCSREDQHTLNKMQILTARPVIDYRLATQLIEADFPFTESASECVSANGDVRLCTEGFRAFYPAYKRIPSFRELIAAIPPELLKQGFLLSNGTRRFPWEAAINDPSLGVLCPMATGDTPEEAIAKLWLKIQAIVKQRPEAIVEPAPTRHQAS